MYHQPLSKDTRKAIGRLSSSSMIAQRGVVITEDGANRFTPEGLEETKEELFFIWEDEFKRRDVERQLGLNDQPVGPKEVRKLLGFLEQAEPVF